MNPAMTFVIEVNLLFHSIALSFILLSCIFILEKLFDSDRVSKGNKKKNVKQPDATRINWKAPLDKLWNSAY